MSENLDALKGGYDAFNSGDMDAVLEVWSDDIRWEGSTNERIPGGGKYDGKDEAKQVLENIPQNYDGLAAPADEYLEDGDTIVVLGRFEGKVKDSGNEFKVPYVHVWRMKNGQAQRVQMLTDTAEILHAVEG
jgi:ketosteroid isomerase-like protein